MIFVFFFLVFCRTCHLHRKRERWTVRNSYTVPTFFFSFLHFFKGLHRCLLVVICSWLITGWRDLTVLQRRTHLFSPQKKMERMSCLIIDMYAGKWKCWLHIWRERTPSLHAVICFLRLEANVTTKCHLSFVLPLALGYAAHRSTGAFYQLTQLLQCWILPKGFQDASLSVLGQFVMER